MIFAQCSTKTWVTGTLQFLQVKFYAADGEDVMGAEGSRDFSFVA